MGSYAEVKYNLNITNLGKKTIEARYLDLSMYLQYVSYKLAIFKRLVFNVLQSQDVKIST